MAGWPEIWQAAGLVGHLAGAAAALLAAAWIGARHQRFGAAGRAIVGGLACAGLWSILAGLHGGEGVGAALAEGGQNLVWLAVVFRLFASDGRHTSVAAIRPVASVLAVVIAIHMAFSLLVWRLALWREAPLEEVLRVVCEAWRWEPCSTSG